MLLMILPIKSHDDIDPLWSVLVPIVPLVVRAIPPRTVLPPRQPYKVVVFGKAVDGTYTGWLFIGRPMLPIVCQSLINWFFGFFILYTKLSHYIVHGKNLKNIN